MSAGGPPAQLIALAPRLDACLLEPRTPDDALLRELRAQTLPVAGGLTLARKL